jgi:hypothetical protein
VALSGSGVHDLRGMIAALHAGDVRSVITGSVAAAAWAGGFESPPGDLDIAPDLSTVNLERLAALLERSGARPVHRPDWKRTLSPEACAAWRPWPATAEQLDHQLTTPWGLLDVVPRISGEYSRLLPRASAVDAWGASVLIAHPEDLLATLRPDREPKHRRREPILRAALERAASGRSPIALTALAIPPPA